MIPNIYRNGVFWYCVAGALMRYAPTPRRAYELWQRARIEAEAAPEYPNDVYAAAGGMTQVAIER